MQKLTKEIIKTNIAESSVIYKRGESIFRLGNFYLQETNPEKTLFSYIVDGNYGDYDVEIHLDNGDIKYSCSCPFPGNGCKHTVAICLDIMDRLIMDSESGENDSDIFPKSLESDQSLPLHLTYEEIKEDALHRREKSAKNEAFEITQGDLYKGEHLVTNKRGQQYIVTLHDPIRGKGHCTCPDFMTNRLETCKHLIYLYLNFKKKKDFSSRTEKERFPFIHLYWDGTSQTPKIFHEKQPSSKLLNDFEQYFDNEGSYKKADLAELYGLIEKLNGKKGVKIDENIFQKLEGNLFQKEIMKVRDSYQPNFSLINTDLYPYQKEGVHFALFKKSAIIADEMGLGKTIQAISLSLFKRELFNFEKVLIISPASLKEQWKREIEKFTEESAIIVEGSKGDRQRIYQENNSYFTITNYEAVLRDILAISRFRPDLVILDEAQRIKNFETKTHKAINSVPHKQSVILTGTPLENKLEDLYSIVQFADPELLTPLWKFASAHFILHRDRKKKVAGYKNLNILHEKLKTLVIRRRKEEVLDDLPELVSNDYYIDLTDEQLKIHQGYLSSLLPLLNKKFQTPMDLRHIQNLLLSMRMVCNSTYLIDRRTNLSPKLIELERILTDIVVQNQRKTVIFSEWTTMTMLIGKVLSDMRIPFVEFTGKVPVSKRQKLIHEFNENPNCKVFLSTDAGGVGLNLQRADCVINFELPWNPAKLKQRIGRVMRIGQKSKSVNAVNLIAKNSIEEKVYAGINLKQELFSGVFDGTTDQVEFSQEKKAEFINKIREMLGEEKIIPPGKQFVPVELPDSTPHFLNPKVLKEKELGIAELEELEENEDFDKDLAEESLVPKSEEKENEKNGGKQPENPKDYAKMEEVLNQGMQFLNGLMAMATGKPLITDTDSEKEKKSISVDQETGEVLMRFKLPGF